MNLSEKERIDLSILTSLIIICAVTAVPVIMCHFTARELKDYKQLSETKNIYYKEVTSL